MSEEELQPLVRVQSNINLEPSQTHADVFNRGRCYYVDQLGGDIIWCRGHGVL